MGIIGCRTGSKDVILSSHFMALKKTTIYTQIKHITVYKFTTDLIVTLGGAVTIWGLWACAEPQ